MSARPDTAWRRSGEVCDCDCGKRQISSVKSDGPLAVVAVDFTMSLPAGDVVSVSTRPQERLGVVEGQLLAGTL